MLFGHLLTGTAQIFSDVRTYWSPEAVKRVTGWKPDGRRRGRLHPPDQLRRHHAWTAPAGSAGTASPP